MFLMLRYAKKKMPALVFQPAWRGVIVHSKTMLLISKEIRLALVSLVIGISTVVGYLVPKPSVQKNCNDII